MAIRQRGGQWYIYWRDGDKVRQKSLHTADREQAMLLDRAFRDILDARRKQRAISGIFGNAFPQIPYSGDSGVIDIPQIPQIPRTFGDIPQIPRSRKPSPMRLKEMEAFLDSITPLSRPRRQILRRFVRTFGDSVLCGEVTPEKAYEYLEKNFAEGKKNYKGYNNNLTALNKMYKQVLIRAQMADSPFAKIPCRNVKDVQHYRPLSDDEFRRIMEKTDSRPLRVLYALAFYAGCDYSTAVALAWDNLDMERGFIQSRRPKSGTRFCVGIHPDLMKELKALDIPEDKALPILRDLNMNYKNFNVRNMELFRLLDIRDSDEGKAAFHSLRASFFTRCDNARLSRRTINLAGGHAVDRMTDVYSHDVAAALEICALPSALE